MRLNPYLRTTLVFGLILCIAVGIVFRFANLDGKVYSYDEAITSLRISGYSWQEAVETMSDSPLMGVAQFIERYQSVNPQHGVGRTVMGLGKEEAQLTPFYFVLVHLWAKIFGSSVAAVRGFSAILGVALLYAIYRLSNRLFEERLTTLMIVAITALSPFFVLYAQDARPYMLFSLTIVLSAEALWNASIVLTTSQRHANFSTGVLSTVSPQRITAFLAWSLYGLSAVVGLYSHLLFSLILTGHGLYILGLSWQKRSFGLLCHFGGSLCLTILAFSPWLWIMQQHQEAVIDRVGHRMLSLEALPEKLFALIRISTRIVLDTHWAGGVLRVSQRGWLNTALQSMVAIAILLLIAYACYRLSTQTPFAVWGIILLPTSTTLLALLAKGSLPERYLMAYFLGVIMAVGYCLSSHLTIEPASQSPTSQSSSKPLKPSSCQVGPPQGRPRQAHLRQTRWWLSITVLVLLAGLCSAAISAKTPLWSIKYPSSTAQNIKIANVLNQADNPYVIVHQPLEKAAFGKAGQDRFGRMLALSHLLDPSVTLVLVNQPQQLPVLPNHSNYFLYRPDTLITQQVQAQQGYELLSIERINNKDLMLFSVPVSQQSIDQRRSVRPADSILVTAP